MNSIGKTAFCLLLLARLQSVTECFSGGAPNAACTGVSPDPTQHSASPQMTDVPYVLTSLPPANYTPGMSYTLTLSGMTSETFRGFLVVSTNSSGRVGSFTPGGADSQLTCTDMRGITHTDRTDKVNVNFTWTAPDEGTGTVEVRFAVVRMRVTYWANQLAATLQEAQPQPEPSTSPDMPTPSATSASQSPSPTATPAGGGGNSTPSSGPGSLAAILLTGIAFVVVAVLA